MEFLEFLSGFAATSRSLLGRFATASLPICVKKHRRVAPVQFVRRGRWYCFPLTLPSHACTHWQTTPYLFVVCPPRITGPSDGIAPIWAVRLLALIDHVAHCRTPQPPSGALLNWRSRDRAVISKCAGAFDLFLANLLPFVTHLGDTLSCLYKAPTRKKDCRRYISSPHPTLSHSCADFRVSGLV